MTLLTILLAGTAWALCEESAPELVPADGTEGAPTDVRPVWIDSGEQPVDLWLLGPTGAEVEIAVEWTVTSDTDLYARITPIERLAPGARYVVTDGITELSFTTGKSTTTGAPEVPTVTDASANARGTEGDCEVTVTIEDSPAASVHVEATSPTPGTWLEARIRGDTEIAYTIIGTADSVIISGGGCGGQVAELLDWNEAWVSVRAVDYAGNASAWTEESRVDIPWTDLPECEEPSATCSALPLTALPVLFPVVPVIVRRRARK